MKAARGMVVSIQYVLADDKGTVIDRSEDGQPLAYLHGYGNIIPGLEKALEGEEAGYKSKVVVSSDEGYGERDPGAVFTVSRDSFPEGMDVVEGMVLGANGPDGPMMLTVMELTEDQAVLDANHPLAGETLHFDVEIVEVREASPEELTHGHLHGDDSCLDDCCSSGSSGCGCCS